MQQDLEPTLVEHLLERTGIKMNRMSVHLPIKWLT